jgi:hypothetical protein
MEIATIRDLLIIILFSLLIIVIIAGSIYGFIVYRRVNRAIQNAMETIRRPIRTIEKIFAYATGGAKGVGEAFSILRGKDGTKDEHTTNTITRH